MSDKHYTPNSCILTNKIFHITKIKNKKKWSGEEDRLLVCLADKFKEKHWKDISKHFSNKNPLQCFSRYKRIRPGIIKGSWSKDEDEKIINLVNQYGKSWSKIAKILTTRNGKQIRDRYTNVLDPIIKKGKFSDDEDKLLIKLYITYGPKWAAISKNFPSRTADMIKNRFHSSIKKIFFTQDCITRQTKTMISLKEKKMTALHENEISNSTHAFTNSNNVVIAGQSFSLQSINLGKGQYQGVDGNLDKIDGNRDENIDIELYIQDSQNNKNNNANQSEYKEEDVDIFSPEDNLFTIEEYFTFDN